MASDDIIIDIGYESVLAISIIMFNIGGEFYCFLN